MTNDLLFKTLRAQSKIFIELDFISYIRSVENDLCNNPNRFWRYASIKKQSVSGIPNKLYWEGYTAICLDLIFLVFLIQRITFLTVSLYPSHGMVKVYRKLFWIKRRSRADFSDWILPRVGAQTNCRHCFLKEPLLPSRGRSLRSIIIRLASGSFQVSGGHGYPHIQKRRQKRRKKL